MSDFIQDTHDLMDTMLKIDPNHVMESTNYDDSSNEWFKQDSLKKCLYDDELLNWFDHDCIDISFIEDEEKSNNNTIHFGNVKDNHGNFIFDENSNKSNYLQNWFDTDCIDFSTINEEKKSKKSTVYFESIEDSHDFVLINKSNKKSTYLKKSTNQNNGNFSDKESHKSLLIMEKYSWITKSSVNVEDLKFPKLRVVLPPKEDQSWSFILKTNKNLTPFNEEINQSNMYHNNLYKMNTVNVERKYLSERQQENKNIQTPIKVVLHHSALNKKYKNN